MKKSFGSAVSDRLALPPESVTGVSLIRISGRERLCVENHGGIVEYEENSIRIAVRQGKGRLSVRGCGLHVVKMTRAYLEIRGTILGLELE